MTMVMMMTTTTMTFLTVREISNLSKMAFVTRQTTMPRASTMEETVASAHAKRI